MIIRQLSSSIDFPYFKIQIYASHSLLFLPSTDSQKIWHLKFIPLFDFHIFLTLRLPLGIRPPHSVVNLKGRDTQKLTYVTNEWVP